MEAARRGLEGRGDSLQLASWFQVGLGAPMMARHPCRGWAPQCGSLGTGWRTPGISLGLRLGPWTGVGVAFPEYGDGGGAFSLALALGTPAPTPLAGREVAAFPGHWMKSGAAVQEEQSSQASWGQVGDAEAVEGTRLWGWE